MSAVLAFIFGVFPIAHKEIDLLIDLTILDLFS